MLVGMLAMCKHVLQCHYRLLGMNKLYLCLSHTLVLCCRPSVYFILLVLQSEKNWYCRRQGCILHMDSVQRLRNDLKHSCTRTVVLLHISYLDEPFVTESERLTCSTVDRELGNAGWADVSRVYEATSTCRTRKVNEAQNSWGLLSIFGCRINFYDPQWIRKTFSPMVHPIFKCLKNLPKKPPL